MNEGSLPNLRVPESWSWHGLGRIAERSRECGTPELQPLSVFIGAGVVLRADRDDNHNQLGADMAKYLTVRPGDIVFNKLRAWQGGLGVSRYEGIVSPAYYVLRPRQDIEPRYLHHLLHSDPYIAELTRLSKWMPPSQFDLPWEDLKPMLVPIPSAGEQRRIADFLDDHVSRIDQVVALRTAQLGVLLERARSSYDRIFDGPERPLKSLLEQDPCYGVLVPRFVDLGGVPFIRVGDLSKPNLCPHMLVEIEAAQSREYRRTVIRAGDVLLSVVGSTDKVLVVTPDLAGCNVARAVARLVPGSIPAQVLIGWARTSRYAYFANLATASDTAQPRSTWAI